MTTGGLRALGGRAVLLEGRGEGGKVQTGSGATDPVWAKGDHRVGGGGVKRPREKDPARVRVPRTRDQLPAEGQA